MLTSRGSSQRSCRRLKAARTYLKKRQSSGHLLNGRMRRRYRTESRSRKPCIRSRTSSTWASTRCSSTSWRTYAQISLTEPDRIRLILCTSPKYHQLPSARTSPLVSDLMEQALGLSDGWLLGSVTAPYNLISISHGDRALLPGFYLLTQLPLLSHF